MKVTLGILGSAISTWIIYYITLPALNVNSVGFWTFLLISLLENGDFQEDIEEISFTQIPKIDRDTSRRLGDQLHVTEVTCL